METEETFITTPSGERIYGMWYAKNSCKHCFGRGFDGINTKTKEKIMCRCLKFVRRVLENDKKTEDCSSD